MGSSLDPSWVKVFVEIISILAGMIGCAFYIGRHFQKVESEMSWFRQQFVKGEQTMNSHGTQLLDHEKRLTVVEVQLPQLVRKRTT